MTGFNLPANYHLDPESNSTTAKVSLTKNIPMTMSGAF
jgi:hypothetical protein